MKILLLANYLPDAQESMKRFVTMLETSLTQLNHQVRVIRPEPWMGRLKASATGLGKWLGYIDKFILFPQTLQQAVSWADIVHICDHSNAIYTKYLQNIPHLVTCHDLLAIRSSLGEIPENPTKWTGKQLQQMILNGLNRAQHVVCVSQQTQNDLLRLSSLESHQVSVIYMSLNYAYSPMPSTEANLRLKTLGISSHSPFLLHVGGNHWYKNRLGVLSIFNHLRQIKGCENLSLIIAGQEWTPAMHQFIQQHNLSQKVVELVAVENEDLRALYSTATALLFPSFQEGFGWPIIEAQACGCPVITSHKAPMTEVGGETVLYIDPYYPEEAANKIAYHLPTIENLKSPGFINVKQFRLEQMLENYIQLYQTLILEKN